MARKTAPPPPDRSGAIAAAYDTIAYPTHPQENTHPDRLAVMARLMGMQPKPIDRCRVLEIGCGDGSNLLPIAAAFPQSECVGVDIAAAPIARGQALITEAGLANARLVQADLRAIDASYGTFDYIIAHGLYSWVPPEVRERLMAVVHERLAPQGVAMVSYNTLPGGHIRQLLREMLFFHLRALTDPAERAAETRAFVALLASVPPRKETAGYSTILQEYAQRVAERSDADLIHDDLAPINDPLYFTAFMGHAAAHGLQFLAEADFSEMQEAAFPPDVATILRSMGARDVVLKEQYQDFLKCRRFRMTLLCHAEVKLDRAFDPNRITGLQVSSSAKVVAEAEETVTFESVAGGTAETKSPVARAVFQALIAAQPHSLGFPQLLEVGMGAAGEFANRFKVSRQVAEVLYGAFGAGIVTLHTRPLHVVDEPAERPVASPLARAQVRQGREEVATLRHTRMAIPEEAARALVLQLDGSHDRATLAGWLAEHADTAAESGDVAGELDAQLRRLGQAGLLVE